MNRIVTTLVAVAITATPLALTATTANATSNATGRAPVAAHPTDPTAPPARPFVKVCKSEDAPGPCVWPARLVGNGYGKSYFVDHRDRVHYMPHRAAHSVIGYVTQNCER